MWVCVLGIGYWVFEERCSVVCWEECAGRRGEWMQALITR
jgi:hypothetical protein